jgi:hypothetical protein
VEKIHDYRYETYGYWDFGTVCRVRIYTSDDPYVLPIVLVTETSENSNTSITNLAENLAAEIRLKHEAEGIWNEFGIPFVWVEHYERDEHARRVGLVEEFDLVTFEDYMPRTSYLPNGGIWQVKGYERYMERGGRTRPSLGTPKWRSSSREEVEKLIEQEVE